MRSSILSLAMAAAASVTAAPAQDTLPNGTYELANHPTWAQGLMMANFVYPDVWLAFDFNHPDSYVLLTKTPSKIYVHGVARAHTKVNESRPASEWVDRGMWQISFTYDTGLTLPDDENLSVAGVQSGGIQDIRVVAPDSRNEGVLTDLGSGIEYPITDKANHQHFTFQLGDKGGEGHSIRPSHQAYFEQIGVDTDYSPGGGHDDNIGGGGPDQHRPGDGDGPGNSGDSNGGNGGGNSGGGNDDDDDDNAVPVSGWGWLQPDYRAPGGHPRDFKFIIKRRVRGQAPQDG